VTDTPLPGLELIAGRTPGEAIEQARGRARTPPQQYWAIVELTPAPAEPAHDGWTALQREIVTRDSLEDAEKVLEVLNATSLGDEVFAIQSRWR
jgi:hypothetical protein